MCGCVCWIFVGSAAAQGDYFVGVARAFFCCCCVVECGKLANADADEVNNNETNVCVFVCVLLCWQRGGFFFGFAVVISKANHTIWSAQCFRVDWMRCANLIGNRASSSERTETAQAQRPQTYAPRALRHRCALRMYAVRSEVLRVPGIPDTGIPEKFLKKNFVMLHLAPFKKMKSVTFVNLLINLHCLKITDVIFRRI